MDAYRFLGTVEAFLAGWVVLTLVARLVAGRRDPKFMRVPADGARQSGGGERPAGRRPSTP